MEEKPHLLNCADFVPRAETYTWGTEVAEAVSSFSRPFLIIRLMNWNLPEGQPSPACCSL